MPIRWKYWILSKLSKECSKGSDVYLHPSVQMLGAQNVAIGNNSCISEQTWLNVNHRNQGEIAIKIGDNCFIGRRNFFSSGKEIEIGHYVLTTIDCKFVCSSHITDNPLVPYITSGTTSDETIRVGANCFFGTNSMVLGNVSVGHGSVIGANSLVTRDIPPFSMVIGNPAKVLRRYSFTKKEWIDSDNLTDEDLRENPNEDIYLNMLRRTRPKISMPIIAAGSDLGNL
jgi:acetyltransferase-like isoleucine patch superfamily enzyme